MSYLSSKAEGRKAMIPRPQVVLGVADVGVVVALSPPYGYA